jgi:hypothetical protein
MYRKGGIMDFTEDKSLAFQSLDTKYWRPKNGMEGTI